MRERIEYYIVKLFIFIAFLMPKQWVYATFKFLAISFFNIDKKRRYLTINNLTLAFPEFNEKKIKDLAKQNYIELSKTVAEIILMINRQFDINEVVTNKEEIVKKLNSYKSENGKVFITAHFANWELLAQFIVLSPQIPTPVIPLWLWIGLMCLVWVEGYQNSV